MVELTSTSSATTNHVHRAYLEAVPEAVTVVVSGTEVDVLLIEDHIHGQNTFQDVKTKAIA